MSMRGKKFPWNVADEKPTRIYSSEPFVTDECSHPPDKDNPNTVAGQIVLLRKDIRELSEILVLMLGEIR